MSNYQLTLSEPVAITVSTHQGVTCDIDMWQARYELGRIAKKYLLPDDMEGNIPGDKLPDYFCDVKDWLNREFELNVSFGEARQFNELAGRIFQEEMDRQKKTLGNVANSPTGTDSTPDNGQNTKLTYGSQT
jgi:hypothetical protein